MKEKAIEADEWIRTHDMPHEDLMDDLDIETDDLSAKIRAEIRRFDVLFDKALSDGFVDMNEHQQLVKHSKKISAMIRQERDKEKSSQNNSSNNAGVNVFGMILCGILGAAIGAELTKNNQT